MKTLATYKDCKKLNALSAKCLINNSMHLSAQELFAFFFSFFFPAYFKLYHLGQYSYFWGSPKGCFWRSKNFNMSVIDLLSLEGKFSQMEELEVLLEQMEKQKNSSQPRSHTTSWWTCQAEGKVDGATRCSYFGCWMGVSFHGKDLGLGNRLAF